jgi:hypothetical protein
MALQGRRKSRRCAGHLGCHRSKERCSCRCHDDGFTTKGSDLVRLPSWREEKSRVESNRRLASRVGVIWILLISPPLSIGLLYMTARRGAAGTERIRFSFSVIFGRTTARGKELPTETGGGSPAPPPWITMSGVGGSPLPVNSHKIECVCG